MFLKLILNATAAKTCYSVIVIILCGMCLLQRNGHESHSSIGHLKGTIIYGLIKNRNSISHSNSASNFIYFSNIYIYIYIYLSISGGTFILYNKENDCHLIGLASTLIKSLDQLP